MEGSITQLNLSNYLINNKAKKKSFFKHSYQNYSNFVRTTQSIPFKNEFKYGTNVVCKIDEAAKYGDLITNIMVEIELPTLTTTTSGAPVGWCNGIGNALMKWVELRIGGNLIDKHTSEWMDTWSEIYLDTGILDNYKTNLIKKFEFHNYDSFKGGKIYIPLQFWFCQNSTSDFNNNLILPIAALNKNDIELKLNVRDFADIVISEDGTLPETIPKIINANLLIDFVILEKQERLELLRNPNQFYLITQIQELEFNIEASTKNKTVSLRELKYPVSELFWAMRTTTAKDSNIYFNYGDTIYSDNNNPISKCRISFENKDRVPELSSDYFHKIEPFKVHNNFPTSFVHCYSFALNPEKIGQPDGVCNFSNLSNPALHFTFRNGIEDSTLFIFALNYNVLQIDKNGNTWLLHNLSKNTPDTLPNTVGEDCISPEEEEKKKRNEKLNRDRANNNTRIINNRIINNKTDNKKNKGTHITSKQLTDSNISGNRIESEND